MTIDIKAFAKKAGGEDCINVDEQEVIAFRPTELAEFVRLVRESALDEAAEVCDEFETNLLHTGARSESAIAGTCKEFIEDLK